jgi:hypothetical protein
MMIRTFGRSFLGIAVVLQAVQPALACPCAIVHDSCGCAAGCESCEPVVLENQPCGACGAEIDTPSCGCEAEPTEQKTEDEAPKSLPAKTNKPKTFDPSAEKSVEEVIPPSETPVPTLDTPVQGLAPAPINVPSLTEPAPATEEIFPGPAPIEDAPVEESPATSGTNTEGLFDEPAPIAEPSKSQSEAENSPTSDTMTEDSAVPADLFVEPSRPAEDTTESSDAETQSDSNQTPPAEDPLDDLFAPPSPATDPAVEPESKPDQPDGEETDRYDPFSQQELPTELRVPGGLASHEFRNWSNRTASFHCDARLVRLTTDGVFLAEPSGGWVAMSFSQLSDADLSFVRAQIRAQRMVLANSNPATQIASKIAP